MTKWLLFSDLCPVFLFSCCFALEPSLLIAGVIMSRVSSLVFHLFSETHPHLINLDYIGIACMSFASPAVCRAARVPHCDEYELVLAVLFAASCAIFIYGLVRKSTPHYGQTIIIGLAIIAHIPSTWAVITAQTWLLFTSLSAFLVGYFVVEPRSHIAWHWIAAAGQGMLVYSV